MTKKIILLFLPIFFGCATPKGKLTTTIDYFITNKPMAEESQNKDDSQTKNKDQTPGDNPLYPQMEELNNKIDKLEKTIDKLNNKLTRDEATKNQEKESLLEHNISVSKIWSIVLNNERAGDVYSGLSLTGTTFNNLFSFKLMLTGSKDYLVTEYVELIKTPEEIKLFIPIETIAQIKTFNYVKDFIIMPSVTVPLLNYKVKFGFGAGSEPNIVSRIELRTGLAYDLYLHYTHGDHHISFLDGQDKKLALPSGISEDGYFSNLTSINLDLAPVHVEVNFIFNTKEIKTAIGIGLIW